jgi:hypothetical protein
MHSLRILSLISFSSFVAEDPHKPPPAMPLPIINGKAGGKTAPKANAAAPAAAPPPITPPETVLAKASPVLSTFAAIAVHSFSSLAAF